MHAVIFDIDGTLLESADVDDRLYRRAVETVLGPVQFRESLHHYDHVTDAGILAQVLLDNGLPSNPDRMHAIRDRFVGLVRDHIDDHGPFREIPGARDMLGTLLGAEGFAVAIATGGWGASARLKLETAEFLLDDIPIVSADDAWDRAEIMRIALARLGAKFDSVTYYGDGPWDRVACERLGWDFVAVGPALGGLDSYHGVRIRRPGRALPPHANGKRT